MSSWTVDSICIVVFGGWPVPFVDTQSFNQLADKVSITLKEGLHPNLSSSAHLCLLAQFCVQLRTNTVGERLAIQFATTTTTT